MKEDYSKRLSEIEDRLDQKDVEDDKLREKIDNTNYELLQELASIKRRLSDIESKIGIR
jgi:tetrahydromethanopterin S-methyltransferase subunit G